MLSRLHTQILPRLVFAFGVGVTLFVLYLVIVDSGVFVSTDMVNQLTNPESGSQVNQAIEALQSRMTSRAKLITYLILLGLGLMVVSTLMTIVQKQQARA